LIADKVFRKDSKGKLIQVGGLSLDPRSPIEPTVISTQGTFGRIGDKEFRVRLMHELGHSLGLMHGGPIDGVGMKNIVNSVDEICKDNTRIDNELCQFDLRNKPNHLSVMNYLYANNGYGLSAIRKTLGVDGLYIDEDGILDYATVPIENLKEGLDGEGKRKLADSVQVNGDPLYETSPEGFPEDLQWPNDYKIFYYYPQWWRRLSINLEGLCSNDRCLGSGQLGESMDWKDFSDEEIEINWSGNGESFESGSGKTDLIVDTEWNHLWLKDAYCIGKPVFINCKPWNESNDAIIASNPISEPGLIRYFSSYTYFLSHYKKGSSQLMSAAGKKIQLGAFLFNAGKEADSYLIEVETDNGWMVQTDTNIALGSGHNRVLSIFVQVPDNANYGHKERIRIKAYSQGNKGLAEEISFFIKVDTGLPVDADADNLPDDEEVAFGLDPTNPDSDGDGIYDGVELINLDDPEDLDHDGNIDAIDPDNLNLLDSDNDGVGDEIEVSLGLDPHNPDTDDDGINDGLEVELKRPGSIPYDFDDDGVIDALEGGDTAYDGIIHVNIDIKPGNDQNNINLGANGVIPVAILSSDIFNAVHDVNPETLTLAGAKVKTPGKSNKTLCSAKDVNSDGLNDLVCKFENDLDLKAGETTAILEGMTFDNIPIRGEDAVRIVP